MFGVPLALLFFAAFWNVNAVVSDRSYSPDTLAPPLELVSIGKVARSDRPALNFLAARLSDFGRQGEFADAVRRGDKAEIAVWLDGLRRWSPALGQATIGSSDLLGGGSSTVNRDVNGDNFVIAVPIAGILNTQVGSLVATVPAAAVAEINTSAVPAEPINSSVATGRVPVVYAPALASEEAPVRTAATVTALLTVLAILSAVIIYRSTQYVAAYVEALIGSTGSAVRRVIHAPAIIVDATMAMDGGVDSTVKTLPQRKHAPDESATRRAA